MVALRRFLAVLAVLWLGSVGALAADPPKDPAAPDLPALIETLKNDQARDALIKQLTALAAQQTQAAAPVENADTISGLFGRGLTHLSDGLARLGTAVSQAAGTLATLPDELSADTADWRNPERQQRWLTLAGKVVLLLLCALVSEWLLTRALRGPRQRLADRPSETKLQRWLLLAGRFLLDLLPVLTFAAAALITLSLIAPDRLTRLVLVLLINANLIVRIVLLLGRLILAPDQTRFRLVTLSDETAAYCYIWLRRIVALAVYGFYGVDALRLLSLPNALADLLERLIGLALAGMVIVLILQNAEAVRLWLRAEGREPTRTRALNENMMALRRRVADIWHILAIVYVVAAYIVWTLEIPGGFLFLLRATGLTLVLLVAGRWLKHGLRRLVTLGFTISPDFAARFPGLEARANRYLPVLQTMLSVGVTLLALVLLLQIWGLDSLGWLIQGSGRKILSSMTVILVVIVAAVIVWEILSSWIERMLQETDHEGGQRFAPSARMRTLLPLLRNALLVVLVIMVSLIVLSEIGINIAPLLAGAGVVGLAIGFGAQTLVKDLITGLFILIEDSIAVGDAVDVAGKSGTVEAMTIRTIRLRDLRGAVHTIPFSAVTTIQNNTKNFSFAVVDLTVDYATNLDLAIETLRNADTALRNNPDYANAVMEPMEIFGIDRFQDSAMVLRVRVKTLPGKQWGVGRLLNRSLKEAFDKAGVSIPGPQQVLLHTGSLPTPAAPAAPDAD